MDDVETKASSVLLSAEHWDVALVADQLHMWSFLIMQCGPNLQRSCFDCADNKSLPKKCPKYPSMAPSLAAITSTARVLIHHGKRVFIFPSLLGCGLEQAFGFITHYH